MPLPNIIFCFTMVIIQLFICAFGYIGNIIICIVIASNKSMYTNTNVYLFNLAIADIVMLTVGLMDFTIPYWNVIQEKRMEWEGCIFRKSMLNTSFNVAIMTIMAFTIERYLATCHPFLARRILSISKTIKLIFVIWIIGSLLGYLVGFQYKMAYTVSYNHQKFIVIDCSSNVMFPYIVNAQFIVFYILPFLLLMILYILIWKKLTESSKIQKNHGTNINVENSSEIQSDDTYKLNRKIFKMLITVVAVFFITWGPYHIGRLYMVNFDTRILYIITYSDNEKYFIILKELAHAIYSMAYFISASANPIIYSAMSNKFRDSFKEVLLKCWPGRRKEVRKPEDKQGAMETRV